MGLKANLDMMQNSAQRSFSYIFILDLNQGNEKFFKKCLFSLKKLSECNDIKIIVSLQHITFIGK